MLCEWLEGRINVRMDCGEAISAHVGSLTSYFSRIEDTTRTARLVNEPGLDRAVPMVNISRSRPARTTKLSVSALHQGCIRPRFFGAAVPEMVDQLTTREGSHHRKTN